MEKPLEIQHVGNEVAVKWSDGHEQYLSLETLRRACPCAGCKGEVDILGNLYKNPVKPYAPNAFELVRLGTVGGYAIQPVWADGHNTGLFSFDFLRRIGA